MDNSQHTPDLEAVGNLIRTSMAPVGNRLRGMLIAECFDANHQSYTDEAKANARLFAAASALLAALRIAVRQNSHDMLMTGEELRACEAAIAKATGSSHE